MTPRGTHYECTPGRKQAIVAIHTESIAMSPNTVWQPIVGSVPTRHGLVIECLACGHPGKRTEPARVAQRMAEGRTRRCGPCTKANIVEVQQRNAAIQQSTCAGKRVYLSAAAAQAEAARRQGRQQGYQCRVCRQWHLTTA